MVFLGIIAFAAKYTQRYDPPFSSSYVGECGYQDCPEALAINSVVVVAVYFIFSYFMERCVPYILWNLSLMANNGESGTCGWLGSCFNSCCRRREVIGSDSNTAYFQVVRSVRGCFRSLCCGQKLTEITSTIATSAVAAGLTSQPARRYGDKLAGRGTMAAPTRAGLARQAREEGKEPGKYYNSPLRGNAAKLARGQAARGGDANNNADEKVGPGKYEYG